MNQIVKDNIDSYTPKELEEIYNNIYLEKKKEIDNYQNEVRKKQSIIGQKLLMNTFQNYKDLVITKNKYGKPYIENNLFFNISHSNNYVVLVTSNKEIGIDIEKIRKQELKKTKFFSTKEEYEYITNSNNQTESFWTIYTLKEAYFKMKGTDLNNIQKVSFKIDNEKITCSDKQVKAQIHNLIPGYIISTCEYIK